MPLRHLVPSRATAVLALALSLAAAGCAGSTVPAAKGIGPAPVSASRPDQGTISLAVQGTSVRRPRTFDRASLMALSGDSVRVRERDGMHTYHGVPVVEVLRAVGVPLGDSLRGPALADYVLMQGGDGYTAAFSLAELDRSLSGRRFLVAWSKDGRALSAPEGPLRLVPADETSPRRSVRMLRVIHVARGTVPPARR